MVVVMRGRGSWFGINLGFKFRNETLTISKSSTEMVKLVYTLGLGSSSEMSRGSSPLFGRSI